MQTGIHIRVEMTPVYKTPCRIGVCTSRLYLIPSLINSAANRPEHRLWLLQESQNDLTILPAATIFRSAIRCFPVG